MNFIKISNEKIEEFVEIDPSKVKIMQGEVYNRKVVKFANSYLR